MSQIEDIQQSTKKGGKCRDQDVKFSGDDRRGALAPRATPLSQRLRLKRSRQRRMMIRTTWEPAPASAVSLCTPPASHETRHTLGTGRQISTIVQCAVLLDGQATYSWRCSTCGSLQSVTTLPMKSAATSTTRTRRQLTLSFTCLLYTSPSPR